MHRHSHASLVVLLAVALAGCAGPSVAPDAALAAPATKAEGSAADSKTAGAGKVAENKVAENKGGDSKKGDKPKAGATTAKGEVTLDCPKLTGRIKLRISQMRAAVGDESASAISRTAQQIMAFGTSPGRGADPEADVRADRALLDSYNRQLVTRNCTPFDIDAELKGSATPNAGRPISNKSAPAKSAPAKAPPPAKS